MHVRHGAPQATAALAHTIIAPTEALSRLYVLDNYAEVKSIDFLPSVIRHTQVCHKKCDVKMICSWKDGRKFSRNACSAAKRTHDTAYECY